MKTKTLLIFLSFVLITLSSCKKDELYYSCNESSDEWVKSNLSKTQVMTRSTWIIEDIDAETKRAAYRSFLPETKRKFWQNKISTVINGFDWNSDELCHLEKLLDFLTKTNMFHNNDNRDKTELFLYKWQDYALETLGWSKKIVYAIAATGEDLLDKNGNVSFKSEIGLKPATKSGRNCSCSFESDFCDIFGEIPQNVVSCNNENYGCESDRDEAEGCGLFYKFECTGVCKSPLL